MGDHFTNVNVTINDSDTKEGSVKALIQGISDAIGYTIEVNSVSVEGNNIKIDFSSSYAPQEYEASYFGFGSEAYHILSSNGVAKTIFDSINKTLKNQFGEDTNVYYSIDDNDILIDNITPIIQINKNEVY